MVKFVLSFMLCCNVLVFCGFGANYGLSYHIIRFDLHINIFGCHCRPFIAEARNVSSLFTY